MIYLIIISLLLLFIFKEFDKKKRKSNTVIRKKSLLDFNNVFFIKLDSFFNNFDFLKKQKENFSLAMGSINTKSNYYNERMVSLVFFLLILQGVFVGIGSWFLFKVWYISLGYILIVFTGTFFLLTFLLNLQRKKIQKKFPEALQLFLDSYVNTKNIKSAIAESYEKMPKEIAPLFEKLARNLATNRDYEEHFLNFAKSLNYVWGYSFAQLLIMSLDQVGDITEQLIFLNSIMQEDMMEATDQKSELSINKMYFFIIIVFGLALFVGNVFLNPLAKELYFNTILGKNLVILWSMFMLTGFVVLTLMEEL